MAFHPKVKRSLGDFYIPKFPFQETSPEGFQLSKMMEDDPFLVDHHVMGGGRSYRSQRGRKAKIGRCQMVLIGWLVDLLVMSL